MSDYAAALEEAFAMATASLVVIDTLEIRHPALEDSFYIAKALQDVSLTLETDEVKLFKAVAFRFTLPAKGSDGPPQLQMSIDNVDRTISDFLEIAATDGRETEIFYRPYLSTDLTTPQMNPPLKLFLRDVSISAIEISARATLGDLVNAPFPKELYTRERFPGIGE
jgi:hypothetical protein